MRERLLICLLVCFCGILRAQEAQMTTLVGEVYDARTGQPIEAVSVYLKNTPYGTATTPEGIFLLRAPLKKKAVMVVSAVGYKKQQFAVAPGISAGVDVALTEKVNYLSEVFVVPGSNPALPLMKRVRQQRQVNDRAVPWDEADRDIQVSVSDIRAKHLRRSLWRNLRGAMLAADDSSLLLPLYRERTQRAQTQTQTALLTEDDWKILLDDFQHSPDFYNNTVPFLATSFLSPLAADGNNYYNFFLADSTNDGRKTYEVHFRTRNPYYATFNGTMHIDSATAALTYIEAEIPEKTGVNYLRGLSLTQHFRFAEQDSAAFVKSDENIRMLLDFAVKSDTSHIFPTLLLTARNHYPVTSATPVSPLATDTLMQQFDSIALNMPVFRAANFFAKVIQTGYIPTGTPVDIGKVTEILHVNPQETVRLGLPLRTNERFSKLVCLEAFLAYGFGDNAWKGAGMVHLNLPTTRRNILSFRYGDEYVRADVSTLTRLQRENSVWFHDMGMTTHIMQMIRHWKALYNTAVRRSEFSVRTENELSDIVETQFFLKAGKESYNLPLHDYHSQHFFRYTSVGATVRLSWDERKVDMFFHRHHIYNHLPVLFLHGETGSIRMKNDDNYSMYGRVGFMLRQRVPLGIAGRLDWILAGGLILGKVPYTRLHVFEGNQSYAYDPYRFTLMDFTRYAADRYLMFHAEWNGRGCLFNLIPGIRVLRLRELLMLKVAYGGWSKKNTLCFPTETSMSTLNIPYVEVGVGIGNILRIGEVYSVWRLTHRNHASDPNWAIRFQFYIDT